MKISSVVGIKNYTPNYQSQNVVSFERKPHKKQNQSIDDKTMLALLALAGYGGAQVHSQKELAEKLDAIAKGQAPSQTHITNVHKDPTLSKYGSYYQGIFLLEQKNAMDRNVGKYQKALDTIRTIGHEKLTSTKPLAPIDKPNPTIWSITSEFAPVKEGGLGSVPPEIRNNAEKLGVNMPTFVPLYLNEGLTTLSKNGENYTYNYKGKALSLEKIATIKMDTFKNGVPKSTPVTFFLHKDTDAQGRERQLIFVHTDNYFDGTIYEANAKTEEPEKFAVFSKAVYEFAKLKMEGIKQPKDIEVDNPSVLEEIKAPDAMIINDWQASPTAALLRYKAVMEEAHNQISADTAQKLKDMRVITIGHNAIYQGSTSNNNDFEQKQTTTTNVLNTLFDRYAYDIVSNATLGADKITDNPREIKRYDNVLLMNAVDNAANYTNFLNMGVVLSDYFNPVSQNYADELISPEHKNLSYELQWALIQKAKVGKMIGIINGNDFANLSIEAKNPQIRQTTGTVFDMYDKTQSAQDIQAKREANKINLYNNFVLPYSKSAASPQELVDKVSKITSTLEFYEGVQGTDMPVLDDSEIINTPILMSGGRLVSQKGIDVLCDAIKMLFDNWEQDFPGKNKPIYYIAGADGENGTQRKIIEDLKNIRLPKEDSDRILFAHGRAPMAAMMAGSDFFLMPSNFEPCGLTQGESLALATPVIASAVGGIVDTINRDGKVNGVLTDKNKPLTAQGFYEAMKEGLEIFFNDKEKYQQMVKDSIAEDFSWAKEGREGPVYDYLEILGVNRNNLPDVK